LNMAGFKGIENMQLQLQISAANDLINYGRGH